MSNPQTLESLKMIGLVPKETVLLEQKDIMLQLTNETKPVLETTKESTVVSIKKKKK